MSHHIVKRIRIEDEKVFITGADNNVTPRNYEEWECVSLSKILQEQGEKALTIEIVKAYEEYSFQAGNQNKYSRAIKKLKRMEEYKKFDWRNNGKDYETAREKRKTKEFDNLLYSAFLMKEDKTQQCIVSNNNLFIKRVNKRNVSFCKEKSRAKKFDTYNDAENLIKIMNDPEGYTIIRINEIADNGSPSLINKIGQILLF